MTQMSCRAPSRASRRIQRGRARRAGVAEWRDCRVAHVAWRVQGISGLLGQRGTSVSLAQLVVADRTQVGVRRVVSPGGVSEPCSELG